MDFTLSIHKTRTADVAVIGGGTAGVFAAIAAAKSGARTVLIEKNSMLGGTVTAANVNYPGLFFAWGKQIIAGPCWDAILRTAELGGAKLPEIRFRPEHHWDEQIRLNPFVYTGVLFEMCRENRVELITNAMISAAMDREDGIRLLVTEKTGLSEIRAKVAIDATGDANLTAIAGFQVLKSDVQQPATLSNHLDGYEIDQVDAQEIRRRFPSADLPAHIDAEDVIAYARKRKISIHIPCADADSSEGKTKLEQDALATVMKIYRFLRTIPGLENLTVDFFAPETGVRESNRILGETVIDAEDYINGFFYPDSVCYAFYPIDLHVMRGIEQKFHRENVVSKIPYRAQIPKGANRILCAGRCISSDSLANSGLRVEAVCMATGQSAGCAAALAAEKNLRVGEVPYGELCQKLREIHAIVPEESREAL